MISYHNITKHYPNRFAKSLGYLDWDSQPSPYKEYLTDRKIKLTSLYNLNKTYENLYLKNQSFEFNFKTIATFLKNSAAINAKKELNSYSWYVRVNPSSGNLHSEEIYIVFENSFYHFNVKEFSLEEIAKSEEKLVEGGFLLILSSIPLREAWKYGERALRYVLLDTGHLIASTRFSSNLLGWNMKYIDYDFSYIFNKFEFFENEEEIFESAFLIYTDKDNIKINFDAIKSLNFNSSYRRLSKNSIRWDIVYKDIKNRPFKSNFINKDINFIPSLFNAVEIIQNRRSALAYNQSYLSYEEFMDILDKTLNREVVPFDVNITLNKVDFLIFANNIEKLKGVYYFNRSNMKVPYTRVTDRLYLIDENDYRDSSKFIHCNQDIARDSSFTINMVIHKNFIQNDFDYKLAMYEAGMIGQILYLEAEAKGNRGCGIGCFFDDLISIDFLNNKDILSLYGFSIGNAVVDERIIKL